VTRDILESVTEDTSCWIAICDGQVVGFTWGFRMSQEKLLAMVDMDVEAIRTMRLWCGEGQIAYQSELGVLEDYRKRGIARDLTSRRNEDFLQNGLEIGVIRTKENPPSVTYQWYQKIGYRVFYRYRDGSARVLMARQLAGLEF